MPKKPTNSKTERLAEIKCKEWKLKKVLFEGLNRKKFSDPTNLSGPGEKWKAKSTKSC